MTPGSARPDAPPRVAEVELRVGPPRAADARGFLLALSGMRYAPALVVVAGHVIVCWWTMARAAAGETPFGRWAGAGAAMLTTDPFLLSILQGGGAALGCFFQLSGFVLAYVYLDGARPTALDRRAFWAARVARVYPVYLLALLFAARLFYLEAREPVPGTIAPSGAAGTVATIVAGVFLLQAWWPPAALAWNAPAWSLSCEAFFYLCFPLVARVVDRLRPGALVATVAGCWVASLLPPLVYLLLDPDGLGSVTWMSDGWWLRVVRFNPLARLPEFVSGVALGKLWLAVSGRDDLRRRGPAMSCGGTALGLAGLMVHDALGVSYLFVHNGFFDLVNAVVIFGLALGGGPLHWLLSRRPIALLGDASYAMYILHLPVIAYALRAIEAHGAPHSSPLLFLVLMQAVATLAALVVHQELEVPMRGVVRGLLAGGASRGR